MKLYIPPKSIDRISQAYGACNLENRFQDNNKHTSSDTTGIWAPSSFSALNDQSRIISYYQTKIDPLRPILDFGSGDHRRLAWMERYNRGLTGPLVGLELHPEVADAGNNVLDSLGNEGIIDRKRIRTYVGDGFNDSTYNQIGIPFSDFGLIFAYLTRRNQDRLIQKAVEESREGTVVMVAQSARAPYAEVRTSRLDRLAEMELLDPDGEDEQILDVFFKS